MRRAMETGRFWMLLNSAQGTDKEVSITLYDHQIGMKIKIRNLLQETSLSMNG